MHSKNSAAPQRFAFVLLALLLCLAAMAAPSPAAPPAEQKVAFLPFEAHAAKDLTYLTSGIILPLAPAASLPGPKSG